MCTYYDRLNNNPARRETTRESFSVTRTTPPTSPSPQPKEKRLVTTNPAQVRDKFPDTEPHTKCTPQEADTTTTTTTTCQFVAVTKIYVLNRAAWLAELSEWRGKNLRV